MFARGGSALRSVFHRQTLPRGGWSNPPGSHSLLWRQLADLSGKSTDEITSAYRRHGDLGSVAAEILPQKPEQGLAVREVADYFRQIAKARGTTAKESLVREVLNRATPREAKYIVKIMTGDLRIGLKESLVEEAIAKACGGSLAQVQRANMLLGNVGETVKLALDSRLGEAKMRLFHPLGFMLASPIETPEEGLSYFTDAAVEDKYDGIRAQAHVSGEGVRFYSRTRDEITESFPELPDALAGLPDGAILDGEIVAWEFPSGPAPPKVVGEAISEVNGNRMKRTRSNWGEHGRFLFYSSGSGEKRSARRCCGKLQLHIWFLTSFTLTENS